VGFKEGAIRVWIHAIAFGIRGHWIFLDRLILYRRIRMHSILKSALLKKEALVNTIL
jgi:hypothetical protein